MTKYATLGYLRDGEKYLLGKKKYGGAKGKLNGFGGKVEETDKNFEEALAREFKEETDLDVKSPNLRGSLVFPHEGDFHVIHVFDIEEYEGKPNESDEMTVDWYTVEEIDLSEMWPNDQIWFRLLDLPFNFVVIFNGPNIRDYNTSIDIRLIEDIDEESYKRYT